MIMDGCCSSRLYDGLYGLVMLCPWQPKHVDAIGHGDPPVSVLACRQRQTGPPALSTPDACPPVLKYTSVSNTKMFACAGGDDMIESAQPMSFQLSLPHNKGTSALCRVFQISRARVQASQSQSFSATRSASMNFLEGSLDAAPEFIFSSQSFPVSTIRSSQ